MILHKQINAPAKYDPTSTMFFYPNTVVVVIKKCLLISDEYFDPSYAIYYKYNITIIDY